MFKFLLLAFLLTMTTSIHAQTAPPIETGVSQTLAKWRAAHYSDVRYRLNLTLEKMSPVLKGTIEIALKTDADRIVLDWRKIRGRENASTVANVSVNGKAAKFEEINEHLVFIDGVVKGENVVKLDFTSPILTSGGAITRYVDKEDGAEYVYSLFVPSDASTAFPVFDQPDLKAKFNLNIKLLGTGYWDADAISNTDWVSKKTDKKGDNYEFKETEPISTYVFAFAVGNFKSFYESDFSRQITKFSQPRERWKKLSEKGDEITTVTGKYIKEGTKIYVRQSQAEKFKPHAAETFRLNREAVKYLESYFDYKFPFPKYDLVLIPEFPFGGMEHAGATYLREDRVIFPTEPTKNDFVTRANLIFHEAAHQWFGDLVTMRWFDDLWLKEGFAEFMAYKTLEKVMPEYNAWKIFYERNKQAAYLTDSTRGTTPIYQEIPNLSSAKSAYGNIVYRKAPSFLRQAEFYLGADKFQTAVRGFLKKHQFANAEWTDLVKEFEKASKQDLKDWANVWVKQPGLYKVKMQECEATGGEPVFVLCRERSDDLDKNKNLNENLKFEKELMKFKVLMITPNRKRFVKDYHLFIRTELESSFVERPEKISLIFPNYQDYGYGIFLLDEKSRAYVLENIQNEKDDFLRTMMWGSLWDSVREAELAPADYVRLVIKNIAVETDESTIQTLLGRVSTAMNYYIGEGGNPRVSKGVLNANVKSSQTNTLPNGRVSASERDELTEKLEMVLIDKMRNAPNLGQRITFYRAFLNVASSDKARAVLKDILSRKFAIEGLNRRGDGLSSPAKLSNADANGQGQAQPLQNSPNASGGKNASLLKTKDKFDIVTKLLILGDKDAPQLLAELEKTETSDEAKRYAYAARAGIATADNKQKYFNDFTVNKELSESYIESALAGFNSPKHADLTLPYLEKALAELPNLKKNRKIFFVNGWLGAFIGGQKSEQALVIVNKFLADNPNLDKDLRAKILENADNLERAVKIRGKFAK